MLDKRYFGIGAGVAVALVMVAMLSMSSALALGDVSVGANNVSTTTEDGKITDTTIKPHLKAQWNGLEKTGNLVFNVDVRIKKDDGSWSVYKDAYLAKRSIKSLEGSMTVDLDKKGLINDIGFAANQFEALNDGKTDATDVKVRVTVKAPDGTKDEDVVSYTVTVHNEPSEVDVGGSLNTGIEA